jgi:hypothetical protein
VVKPRALSTIRPVVRRNLLKLTHSRRNYRIASAALAETPVTEQVPRKRRPSPRINLFTKRRRKPMATQSTTANRESLMPQIFPVYGTYDQALEEEQNEIRRSVSLGGTMPLPVRVPCYDK